MLNLLASPEGQGTLIIVVNGGTVNGCSQFGTPASSHAAWLIKDLSDSSLRYDLEMNQSSEYSIR